ncbi:MAG: PAS domain-containing protein [Gaiellales bacterium]
MPYFICPNCHDRSFDEDGREGLSHQAIGCHKCGFGFLFQLLEDYFPRPGTAFVACDAETRILAAGQGVLELTGRLEDALIGQELVVGLHLAFADGQDPVSTTLEWGVRQMDCKAVLTHAAGIEKRVLCDCFPAYDDDGGLLVAIAPDPVA